MPPLLSIGIPTFNRAHLLADSLGSALAQSLPGIEIIVSDNASTDDTTAVVQALSDSRVSYVRQGTNLGAGGNLKALLEMASADYFCLLQDDDMIFPDLVRRAYGALEENPSASWYACYAVSRTDIGLAYNATLYGPPFRLNWRDGSYRVVPGELLLPLCLVCSPAIPPVTVYRTNVLRQAVARARCDDCALFSERLWEAHASRRRQVILDPYVGGWFRSHPGQANTAMLRVRNTLDTQWRILREEIATLAGPDAAAVTTAFDEYLGEVPKETVVLWDSILRQARNQGTFDRQILKVLGRHGGDANNGSAVRSFVRRLTPPCVWEFLRDHLAR